LWIWVELIKVGLLFMPKQRFYIVLNIYWYTMILCSKTTHFWASWRKRKTSCFLLLSRNKTSYFLRIFLLLFKFNIKIGSRTSQSTPTDVFLKIPSTALFSKKLVPFICEVVIKVCQIVGEILLIRYLVLFQLFTLFK
jgi:hypothetical protein